MNDDRFFAGFFALALLFGLVWTGFLAWAIYTVITWLVAQ